MTIIQKPMLAGTISGEQDLRGLKFPLFVSAKLDGIRCMVIDGKPISRSGKILPNQAIQAFFRNCEDLEGLDGELIIGAPTGNDVYNRSVSGVMTETGNPEFFFHVFDYLHGDNVPFNKRYDYVKEAVKRADIDPFVLAVHQEFVDSIPALLKYEQHVVEQGYEGVILRNWTGPYKRGRSTLKEQTMLKFKRFEDSEAEILNVNELMMNANAPTTDVFGHTERSTHKENMIPGSTMGALEVKDLNTDVVFCIGTGFDDFQRAWFWANRETVRGKIIKYKHFPIGVKDRPRFPTYIGFRDKRDMS